MPTFRTSLFPLLLLLSVTGCVVDDSMDPPFRALTYEPGTLWGPCDPADPWGCDGQLGEGLACLRPVSEQGLNICAPQTWDPAVAEGCTNVEPPDFGLAVGPLGSAYCAVDCDVDEDCGPGLACAPAAHICAWVGR